jgi:radical SAM/Cys-rich protein
MAAGGDIAKPFQTSPTPEARADFGATLARHGLPPLRRLAPVTLQINVGRLCNQACHHCHVDAGPGRKEIMTAATAARVIEIIAANPAFRTIDLTGGAPELNPNFRRLVESARAADREVIVRCNLTVLFAPAMEWLPEFYRDARVHMICSLPCYSAKNVEKQRGSGVFDASIAALRILNRLGFGTGRFPLDLVYNPVGPFLPPAQHELERRYRDELGRAFGVSFDRLLTLVNMPIRRFARDLERLGRAADYMSLLVNHFNPATVEALMCRTLVSVGYDGGLYDCDFNQMLAMPLGAADGRAPTIFDIEDFSALAGARIATGPHCFGCAAGAGSSCGGALA